MEFLDSFKIYSLRILFFNSIISEGYLVPCSIGQSIVLSSYGTALLEKLKVGKYKETEEHLLKFALFIEFYHEDLIIDVQKLILMKLKIF